MTYICISQEAQRAAMEGREGVDEMMADHMNKKRKAKGEVQTNRSKKFKEMKNLF